MELREQIQQLFINAVYNDEAPNTFAAKILELIGVDESRTTRSNLQSRARWKYLNMVASILNERGITYDAIGIDTPIKWTKDILYHIYWQTSRATLYPGKKRQLNSKEFSDLVEHVRDLFAMVFDIHIPFPSIKTMYPPKEN